MYIYIYIHIHCIGSWVGRKVGLDGCGKYLPPPGFDHRTVQCVCVCVCGPG